MQNQENLEYVIGNLKGDEVSSNTLRSRYEACKAEYEELVSITQSRMRGKVKQVVLANAESIESSSFSKRVNKCSKVLLIDEVEVFISEKYYGGFYTPSLVVMDDTIKNLLDAIWQYGLLSKATVSTIHVLDKSEYFQLLYAYMHICIV
jgi:hypothetical protein